MGFYGNITNTSRTSFQFDKTYPNKVALENAATTDEVFIGRFVLVEYGEGQDYNENYQIDINKYGAGRGYDSTVWQKVFLDGKEKYVMIAELNTVVPTFDLGIEAPTQTPLKPHFDENSSNIYYKLHIQPTWGLRVKSSNPDLRVRKTREDGTATTGWVDLSTNEKHLPSDEDIQRTRTLYNNSELKKYYYNPTEEKWDMENPQQTIPAAIYFNRDGFNPETISYNDEIQDSITLEETGYSGNSYISHSSGNTSIQPDVQELSIMLPSIGNAISQMWDIVYGGKKIYGDSNERNMTIDWLDGNTTTSSTGLRLLTRNEDGYTYNPGAVNTLAGAINSVHDLMGMIIVNDSENDEDIDASSLDENKIYYLSGTAKKFYYVHTTYEYTQSNDPKAERYIMSSENKEYPIGMKWTSNIAPAGVILGTRIEKKKLKELEGFAHNYNTIHGLILRINQMLDQGNELTRDTSTVQGIINSLNDILFSFGELAPGQIAVTNQYGQLTTTEILTDDWITASYPGTGEIIIEHDGLGKEFEQEFKNSQEQDATLKFGETFKSPQINIKTDEKGHMTELDISNINLTLPKFSTSAKGNGNVVSGIDVNNLDSINPSITITKNNLGNLSLNTYTKAEAAEDIKSSDSVGAALGKLEYKIGKSEVSSQISDAINKLDVAVIGQDGHYINSIEEVDGKIEATTKEFAQEVAENDIYAVTSGAVYKYLRDTFTGTNHISSVGTITAGTWNGNTIAVKNGGTGLTSLSSGEVLIGNGENAIATRAITNNTTSQAIESNTNLITANTLNNFIGSKNIFKVGTITEGTWSSSLGQNIIEANNIKNGVIGTEKIVDNAITDAKIKNVNISKLIANDGATIEEDLISIQADRIYLDVKNPKYLDIDLIQDNSITNEKINKVSIDKIEGDLSINRLAGGTQQNPLYLDTSLIQTSSITPDKISTNIVYTITENGDTSYSLNPSFIRDSSISISKLKSLENYPSESQVEDSIIINTDTLITALKKLEQSINSLKKSNGELTNKITALEDRLAKLETPEATT